MDLSLIFDWAIQGLKKISGSTILSVISISIAVSVFRFNKKMGYSKLSISPIIYLHNENPEYSLLNFKYHLWLFTWTGGFRGLPVDISEKNFFDLEDGKIISDARFNPKLLTVKIKNKGELAATNIKIILLFKAYGSKIKYDKNEKDIFNWKSSKRKIFSKKKIIIKVPYMGADEEKEFTIVDLREQFRESELILCKIKANGHTYFKEKLLSKLFNRVVINHHTHPFLSNGVDGIDIGDLLGLSYKDEKWIDPYKSNRIEELIWRLRNWYAEWRK